MAAHSQQDIDQVVEILSRAMRDADLEYRLGHEPDAVRTRAGQASAA